MKKKVLIDERETFSPPRIITINGGSEIHSYLANMPLRDIRAFITNNFKITLHFEGTPTNKIQTAVPFEIIAIYKLSFRFICGVIVFSELDLKTLH